MVQTAIVRSHMSLHEERTKSDRSDSGVCPPMDEFAPGQSRHRNIFAIDSCEWHMWLSSIAVEPRPVKIAQLSMKRSTLIENHDIA